MIHENSKKDLKKSRFQRHNPNFDDHALTLEQYCISTKRAPFDVWEEIRAGKLEAREFGGEVYILTPQVRVEGAALDHEELPSLWAQGANHLSLTGASVQNPEMALLIDHLSLAKEENREILKFAQQSLAQAREITSQIVSSKDELLKLRDEKIQLLEEKLARSHETLKKLSQEKEDIEMLAMELASKI
ncbi:MAG: hypothetical protein WCI18_07070 [Pseudomonadota bacterium]